MTRKPLLLIAAVSLAIAMALGIIVMLPHDSGVTRANFDRIEKGMTESQVEAILGRRFDRWGVGIAGMKEWTGDAETIPCISTSME